MKLSLSGGQADEHRNSCDSHLWPGLVPLPHPGTRRLSSGYSSKTIEFRQTTAAIFVFLQILKNLIVTYLLMVLNCFLASSQIVVLR